LPDAGHEFVVRDGERRTHAAGNWRAG
jgi:hypothetical protein